MNDKRKGSASREKPCSHLVSFIYFLMLILCKVLFSVTLTVNLQSVLSTTCNGSSTVVPKTTTSRSGVRSEVMRGSTSEQTQCSIKTRIFVNGAQKKQLPSAECSLHSNKNASRKNKNLELMKLEIKISHNA